MNFKSLANHWNNFDAQSWNNTEDFGTDACLKKKKEQKKYFPISSTSSWVTKYPGKEHYISNNKELRNAM